jgi:hypothetical protein
VYRLRDFSATLRNLGFGTREGGSVFRFLSVSVNEQHRRVALSRATTRGGSP